jgi:asparagine synthetase B (glutamine-hydrolysing)
VSVKWIEFEFKMDGQALEWRLRFLKAMAGLENVPLLLSGGTDSGTILAAQLALGGRPDLYSFRIGDKDHEDVRVARLMAETFQLTLQVVDIPRTEEQLVADLAAVSRFVDRPIRKSHVQCAQPILHLSRRLQRDGHRRAIAGTGGVVEDNRRCAVLLAREGEYAARTLRRKNLLELAGSATESMHRAAAACEVEMVEPFSSQPFADYSLSLDMADINRPKQKGIALRAFPEFWVSGWYRPNSPLQVNSGIREWHDTLLSSSWNVDDNKDVAAVYRRMARSMECPS